MHRRGLSSGSQPREGGRDPLLAPAMSPLSLTTDVFPLPHQNELGAVPPYLGGRLCPEGLGGEVG